MRRGLFALIRLPAQTVAVGSYAALRLSLDEVRWVIAHECAHIRHEDSLSRGLGMGLVLVAYHGVCATRSFCACLDLIHGWVMLRAPWYVCTMRDTQAQRSCCGGDWVTRCTEGIPLQLCALLWSVLGRCW